jgi:hypothetical protein
MAKLSARSDSSEKSVGATIGIFANLFMTGLLSVIDHSNQMLNEVWQVAPICNGWQSAGCLMHDDCNSTATIVPLSVGFLLKHLHVAIMRRTSVLGFAHLCAVFAHFGQSPSSFLGASAGCVIFQRLVPLGTISVKAEASVSNETSLDKGVRKCDQSSRYSCWQP